MNKIQYPYEKQPLVLRSGTGVVQVCSPYSSIAPHGGVRCCCASMSTDGLNVRVAESCCRRCPSFMARITWVFVLSTGVEYNLSSACCWSRGPERHQHISCVARMAWYCARPSRAPPCHIPSPTYFPTPASLISAGFCVHPAVGVAGIAGWASLGHRSSSHTCCSWCRWSRAWKGPWHGHRSASERP